MAEVEQHLVPESRVKQVQHRVLGAADVEVHRHPVVLFVLGDEGAAVVRVNVAQIVPAATGPLRHRIGFAFAGPAALWTFAIHPVGRFRQWRFSVTGG